MLCTHFYMSHKKRPGIQSSSQEFWESSFLNASIIHVVGRKRVISLYTQYSTGIAFIREADWWVNKIIVVPWDKNGSKPWKRTRKASRYNFVRDVDKPPWIYTWNTWLLHCWAWCVGSSHYIWGRIIHYLLRHFYSFKDKELFGALVSAQTDFREMFSLQNSLGLVEAVYSMGKNAKFFGGEFLQETMGSFAFC